MRFELEVDSFELRDIFECGQCFRWKREEDESYTGVIDNYVVNARKTTNNILFDGISKQQVNQDEFENKIKKYFDINRDYNRIKKILSETDENLAISIKYGEGIRILNQDLWETIISFIISANNNIPRIKGIIERLCANYGKKIEWNGKNYYTFPTPGELSKATVSDLRNLGLGFRDTRVYETTQVINSGKFDLNTLYKKSTDEARNDLSTLHGVGPKVADCILLFSDLKRLDVFPVDVWVRRVMNELYIHNDAEEKVNKNDIKKLATEKFGNLQGIAQQYLFYWKREA